MAFAMPKGQAKARGKLLISVEFDAEVKAGRSQKWRELGGSTISVIHLGKKGNYFKVRIGRFDAPKNSRKTKKQRTRVRCSLAYQFRRGTSPKGYLLVERVEGQNACFRVGANASRVNPNDGVFLGAEGADTGLVDRDRNCHYGVTNVNATGDRAGTSRE
jgi:hypothetical protein